MTRTVYFDHSATTPLDPRVCEVMLPYFRDQFGNPSSLHRPGREARAAMSQARQQVASLLCAAPEEIIFTASGTEADNLALLGVAGWHDPKDCHIITSAIEHPAILETCHFLEKRGVKVTYLPVDKDGLVEPASLEGAIQSTTRLVSIMAANNVVGTLQPIRELAKISRLHGVLFHTDAVQAFGKIPLLMDTLPVDLLSFSAHKLYGPKGVGGLYVRAGVELQALVHGGGQERGLRSATENVAGIVGLGKAAEIAQAEMSAEAARLVQFRDHVFEAVMERVPNAYPIGHPYKRLPGHICLGLAGQEGEAIKLLLALDEKGIAISTGSACSSQHAGQPSYILTAMGMDPLRARGSLRITLGRFNTADEVEYFLEVLPDLAADLRSITTRKKSTVVEKGAGR